MAERKLDKYANMASIDITANGAAVVSGELQTGISLGRGQGILIDEIDYETFPVDDLLAADNDHYRLAWSTQELTAAGDFAVTNNRVIHSIFRRRHDAGAAANAIILDSPRIYQFFPPIIVAAPRIYFNVVGSAAITDHVYSRMYFRYISLTSQEYLELAEAFVLVG